MLKHLQKFFTTASADNNEEVEMSETEKQALAAAELKTAELTELLATATKTLADTSTTLAEISAKYEVAQAALNASEAAQEQMKKTAAEKQLKDRTEAIVNAVGTDKSEALLAATKDLDDTQFQAIVGALVLSQDQEAKSAKFTPKGVDTKADEAPKQAHFKDYIKKDKE